MEKELIQLVLDFCLLYFMFPSLECSQNANDKVATLRPQGNKLEDKSHTLRMAKQKKMS